MKKKATALLLCIAMIVLFVPGGIIAAADDLIFISVNDTLPPELINCVTYYGGVMYVPYYVFSNYGLGISYSYFTSASTAYLYTSENQLFFEMNSGVTYDGDDYRYSVSAIFRNGTVYVPLNFTCRFFEGIGSTVLTGSEHGTVLRLTTGAAVLTDAEFLSAAKTVMRTYSQDYKNEHPDVTPTDTPAATPEPTKEPETHEGDRIVLSFIRTPTAHLLDLLSQNRLRVCFFLTAEDVRSDPDMVRRAAGEGHTLGVYCREDLAEEFSEASALLFEAARVRTILVASPADYAEECGALAEAGSLVFCGSDLTASQSEENAYSAYAVSTWLEERPGGAWLRLGCDEAGEGALPGLLNYLRREKYGIDYPREAE